MNTPAGKNVFNVGDLTGPLVDLNPRGAGYGIGQPIAGAEVLIGEGREVIAVGALSLK